LGISLGVTIKFGKIQQSDAAGTEVPLFTPDSAVPSLGDEEQTITIKAVGDIIPGKNFPNLVDCHKIPISYYQRLSEPTYKDQIFYLVILKFAFRSPPVYAQLFAEVGFDVLNITNNHRMDFGAVQFTDTVKNLEAKGIKTLGHKN
jgi:hypothetical protein